MAKLRWLLMSAIVMGACLPVGAVGGVDETAGVGLLTWATGLQTQNQVSVSSQGTVGQLLTEGIGLSEQLRTRLTTEQSSKAPVALPDVPEGQVSTFDALGAVSLTREETQSQWINRSGQGAMTAETPLECRARVMTRLGMNAGTETGTETP